MLLTIIKKYFLHIKKKWLLNAPKNNKNSYMMIFSAIRKIFHSPID